MHTFNMNDDFPKKYDFARLYRNKLFFDMLYYASVLRERTYFTWEFLNINSNIIVTFKASDTYLIYFFMTLICSFAYELDKHVNDGSVLVYINIKLCTCTLLYSFFCLTFKHLVLNILKTFGAYCKNTERRVNLFCRWQSCNKLYKKQ